MTTISVVGQSGSGKSAWLLRHLTGEFTEAFNEKIDVEMEFDTTCGPFTFDFVECSRPLPSSKGVIIFFKDVENAFSDVENARNTLGKSVPIVLVRSMQDLRLCVPAHEMLEINDLCNVHDVKYMKISSFTPNNIYDPLNYLLHELIGRDCRVVFKNLPFP